MTDRPTLVARLRDRKAFGRNGGTWIMLTSPDGDCAEAADRIEQLEEVLRDLANDDQGPEWFFMWKDIARTTLEQR